MSAKKEATPPGDFFLPCLGRPFRGGALLLRSSNAPDIASHQHTSTDVRISQAQNFQPHAPRSPQRGRRGGGAQGRTCRDRVPALGEPASPGRKTALRPGRGEPPPPLATARIRLTGAANRTAKKGRTTKARRGAQKTTLGRGGHPDKEKPKCGHSRPPLRQGPRRHKPPITEPRARGADAATSAPKAGGTAQANQH